MLLEENQRQNLVSRSSEAELWDRHILDSAQLLDFDGRSSTCWLDVGTGAGFPGLVLAILSRSEHILVEPRRRRADFLSHVIAAIGLGNRTRVVQRHVERLEYSPINFVTARAVSSVENLVASTRHLADGATIWLLHKGRSAAAEIDAAKRVLWADFEMLPSITDPDAAIVKVSNLRSGRA